MKTSESISLIMTIYNKADYLEQCLSSIFSSSIVPKDIILINDGSTDRCAQILSDVQLKNPGIICISHENRGLAVCRNEGVALVRTPYFLFVDADDLIHSNLVECLDELVQRNRFDLVSFNYDKITTDHIPLVHQHKPFSDKTDGPSVLVDYIKSKVTFDSVWSYLYNTDYFRYHEFQFANGRIHEDFGLIPWVILNASSIFRLDKVLNYNVMSTNSIMRTNEYANEVKKAYDVFYHVTNLRRQLNLIRCDQETKDVFVTFLVHTLITKLEKLNRKDQSVIIRLVRQYGMLKDLPNNSMRKKIKNILISVCPKLYLRLTQI